jgi:transcriptional regulator with XRE-family HTH domain
VKGWGGPRGPQSVENTHYKVTQFPLENITNNVILLSIMMGTELRKARLEADWTQKRLASRLGVTQAHVSQMESAKRRVTDSVARRVTSLFHLPPTLLPASGEESRVPVTEERVEQGLARLGYPGFAYRKKQGKQQNPGELLLMALSLDNLDPRLATALPWLLVRFENLSLKGLVAQAKAKDLQNRLGFTVSLAEQVAKRNPALMRNLRELHEAKQLLYRSRLAEEGTYGREETSERMKAWLRQQRSPEAERWNLMTDLKVEHLPYAGENTPTLAWLPKRS